MAAGSLTGLEARFLRYVQVDTQSDDEAPGHPSTARQLDLARMLRDELAALGAAEVELTDYGVVLASIPATAQGAPTIGLLAHMDTSPAFAAAGVKPVVHRAYNGGPLAFPDAPDLLLSPEVSPALAERLGHDIVTASGTTLLGADDKAGIAIVMGIAERLLAGDAGPHGKVRIAFTPDEEIGRGVHPRLPADLGADFAYTFDGGLPGEIEYESFSADGAVVTVTGISAHPGYAKGKLVNALLLAAKVIAGLPQQGMVPELTEGREGFIHVTEVTGTAAEARIKLILRDFDMAGLEQKGAILRAVCAAVQAAEPRARVEVMIRKQYRNMRDWLEKDMRPVDLARAAVAEAGLTPVSAAIRGGTDGSRLTEMGVPCPNLFTGMQEIHGPLEWVSVQDMGKAVEVGLALLRKAAG